MLLAVVLAPLFEEYVFRGLLFGSMRRTLGPLVAAVTSAGIFALVHPPLSVPPVLVLGLAAAWSFERSRLLAAPVAARALYNAAVLAASAWGPLPAP